MEDQVEEEVADRDLAEDPEVEDLAEEDHMLREGEQIDSHDQDLVVEKLLTVHLHQRDHRHLEQIDQPMLREHEDREDDLVETDEEREEEDRLDRIEDEREVVLDSEETEEDLGLDQIDEDLVMERVGADPGSGHDPVVLTGQVEEVTGRHLHSTKPEKLALRKLSSVISLLVVKQRDHREETIGGRSRRNDEWWIFLI